MAGPREQVLHGLRTDSELNPQHLNRDIRTPGQKLSDFLRDPFNVGILLGGIALLTLFYPVMLELSLLVAYIFYRIGCKHAFKEVEFALRGPIRSGATDYSDLTPGTKKPRAARGIFYLGNEVGTNREIWATNEDMRTHILLFGTTGAGKTAILSSMTYNQLLLGDGYLYTDGKADNSLVARQWAMARSVGREDDFLVISFIKGGKDVIGKQDRTLSNTVNIFTFGSSGMISQTLASLLGSSSDSSNGDMWQGRAIQFVEALTRALVYMRDKFNQPLNIDIYRRYFELNKLEAFLGDVSEKYNIPPDELIAFEPLKFYLTNLPGYDPGKIGQQSGDTRNQHGFITMQLTRSTGSLADSYGHVVQALYGEVDFYDVVNSRRLLLILLPALENSPQELSNLGKINIATLKATLATMLGSELEGKFKEIVGRRAASLKTPFLAICDEYGYYAVEGFAVVAAQSRSLGLSVCFSGQDYPAFKRAGDNESASIISNCNIKMCGKLEDPKETWDLFKAVAGEAYVSQSSGYSSGSGVTDSGRYYDDRQARTERRGRIDMLDLKNQSESEAHIFFKDKIIRANAFFADTPDPEETRLNTFISVAQPSQSEIEEHIIDRAQKRRENEAMMKLLTNNDRAPIGYHGAWGRLADSVEKAPENVPRDKQSETLFEAITLDDIILGRSSREFDAGATEVESKPVTSKNANTAKVINEAPSEEMRGILSGLAVAAYSDTKPEKYAPVAMINAAIDEDASIAAMAKINQIVDNDRNADKTQYAQSPKVLIGEINHDLKYSVHIPENKKLPEDMASIIAALSDKFIDLYGNADD